MDHEQAVRQQATERFLLGELDSQQRDEFEEHFFDCHDCANDVKAGAMFIEHSKEIWAEEPERHKQIVPVPPPDPAPARMGWLNWLKAPLLAPAFAALLLLVVGYQNLVQFPALAGRNRPHVLAATSMNLATYGSNTAPLAVRAGEGFLVTVIIPPGNRYASYRAELYNPSGKMDSIPLPTSAADDTWSIQVPGGKRESGTYSFVFYGATANGTEKEVGRGSLQLQIQESQIKK